MSVGGRARRAAHVKLRLPGQRHWVWSALQREVDNLSHRQPTTQASSGTRGVG
jgi:hypothetical protein